MCRIINNNKKREVRHATDCFHMDQKMMCGPRVRRGRGQDDDRHGKWRRRFVAMLMVVVSCIRWIRPPDEIHPHVIHIFNVVSINNSRISLPSLIRAKLQTVRLLHGGLTSLWSLSIAGVVAIMMRSSSNLESKIMSQHWIRAAKYFSCGGSCWIPSRQVASPHLPMGGRTLLVSWIEFWTRKTKESSYLENST